MILWLLTLWNLKSDWRKWLKISNLHSYWYLRYTAVLRSMRKAIKLTANKNVLSNCLPCELNSIWIWRTTLHFYTLHIERWSKKFLTEVGDSHPVITNIIFCSRYHGRFKQSNISVSYNIVLLPMTCSQRQWGFKVYNCMPLSIFILNSDSLLQNNILIKWRTI